MAGDGIRRRMGRRYVPLADLLGHVLAAGLTIEKVREPRHEPVPYILGISAGGRRRSAARALVAGLNDG